MYSLARVGEPETVNSDLHQKLSHPGRTLWSNDLSIDGFAETNSAPLQSDSWSSPVEKLEVAAGATEPFSSVQVTV